MQFFLIVFLFFSYSQASLIIKPCDDIDCLLEEFQREEPKEDYSDYYSGAYSSYISEACHYKNIKAMIHNKKSNKEKGQELTKWLKKCESELSRYNTFSIGAMFRLEAVDYAFDKNPKLLKMEFTYDEDVKVKGILALKDLRKRPLVIVKNGVFGNAENTATVREMLMHLTEEAPFHVLVLGNLTGDDFIKDNGFIAMGGFEEGRQIHEIIKIIRGSDSDIKDLIYDIHVLGISLGGSSALYSALYNRYLPEEEKVQSHIAYCPVVNVKRSVDHVYSPTGTGLLFTFFTKGFLARIFQYVPILGELFDPEARVNRKMMKSVLVESTFRSIRERTAEKPWDYQPFDGVSIRTKKDLWYYNNFTNFSKLVDSPLLVMDSSDDFVVKSEMNAYPLRNVSNDKENFSFVHLNQGGHCAFAISYGWPTISKILKHYILSNSSYEVKTDYQLGEIHYLEEVRNNPRYRFSKYEWAYNNETKNMELNIHFRVDHMLTARGNARCREQDYRFSDGPCYREITYPVDRETLSQFRIDFPENAFKQSYFVRWLNTHFVPINDEGRIPYGKAEIPRYVEFQAELPVNNNTIDFSTFEGESFYKKLGL